MDKSNTVVIMKRERYVSEEHWQLLHVSKHNVQVPVPNSLKLYDDIKKILSEMQINRSLDKAAYKFLNDNKNTKMWSSISSTKKPHIIPERI